MTPFKTLIAGSFILCLSTASLAVPYTRGQPIVATVTPGQVPDSMFGSSSGGAKDGHRLAAYGVKWMRSSGAVPDAVAKADGYNQLLILGFWNRKPADAIVLGTPYAAPKPEAVQAAIDQQMAKLKANPEITAVEFYNEHWWMYSGATMIRFRDDLRRFYLAVKAYNPNITVICGNTPSAVQDDIAVDGGEKYCDGFAPHNYIGNEALWFKDDPFWRYMDWSQQQTIQYGKKVQWLTEGSEWKLVNQGDPPRPMMTMAYKVVQRLATHPFLGIQKSMVFMHGANWSSDEMYQAYGIMSTLLEDKKPAGEIWPASMLTWGHVFEGHGQAVAVIWSLCGQDPLKSDAGHVTIANAGDIAAYDVTGQPFGDYDARKKSLSFDIGNPPVYLISNQGAQSLLAAVKGAKVSLVNPIRAMIEPLTALPGAGTAIHVRLYNGGIGTGEGTVSATVPGWTTKSSVPFSVDSGKFLTVDVPILSATPSDANFYLASAAVTAAGSPDVVKVTQPIQAAFMTKFTPVMDGTLNSWKGRVPVTMATYEKGLDFDTLALNPALMTQAQADGKPPITNALLHLYTAYDDKNLYVAYELTGHQGTGDWLQLGLGLTDWNPRNMRKADDPWAYKGHFYDSDYLFAINDPAGQVWRLSSPDAPWRTPYNWIIQCLGGDATKYPRFVSDPDTENKYFYDLVPKGAQLAATSNNGDRVVECAIPRTMIPEFHPETGKPIRLGFIVEQAPAIHQSAFYEWGKVAGEFPFLKGSGSFVPSWNMLYPNELGWGVEG